MLSVSKNRDIFFPSGGKGWEREEKYMRPEGSEECTDQSQAFSVCRARGAWSAEASGDTTLLCECEESCVLGGGEGPGLLEENVCFRVCVAKAEECNGEVYFGYFFNLFDASGRDATGVREGGPQIIDPLQDP